MPESESEIPSVDLVVFAAHPDDAELNCGGLLLTSRARGWKTAVVDATRGELGSLGTVETRREEARQAAEVLGLTTRLQLGLPDGGVRDTEASREAVISTIRRLRPRVVVAPPRDDHHPDHSALGELLDRCFYLTGIARVVPGVAPHRPAALLHHGGTRPFVPDLIVDVTEVIEDRRRAIECYVSQFRPEKPRPGIRISSRHFLDSVEGRLRHFGSLIGVPHGEPYTTAGPLPVGDPVSLFESEPWRDR